MATSTSSSAPLVATVKAAVQGAALSRQKMATFHFQILKNANALDTVNPAAFCAAIGVPDSFKTEFSKMLKLAQVIRQQGLRLSEA